jgi:hypothetical protein
LAIGVLLGRCGRSTVPLGGRLGGEDHQGAEHGQGGPGGLGALERSVVG